VFRLRQVPRLRELRYLGYIQLGLVLRSDRRLQLLFLVHGISFVLVVLLSRVKMDGRGARVNVYERWYVAIFGWLGGECLITILPLYGLLY